ncbi:hydrophobin-domain-containing protein [Macrolepiota fuliginosa MF-IS2]|uniref:Hydrophobin n=1 Tax=Macrolepiota fuliginosa MF-IS2 TaxID=1400762 RepID=A0A9P6C2G2_9AGAR|nr:hydrophobin-domain-containing protein [Macrolepiota fuliginosa MF-IS2]
MFSRVAAFAYVYVAFAAFVAALPGNVHPTTYTTVSNGHTLTITSTVTDSTTVTKPVTTTVVVTQPVTTTVPVTTTKPVSTTVTVTSPPTATTAPASQCNTGDLQCCNSVQSASSNAVSLLLGLLGVVLSDVTGLVGLTCSPLSVIGVGGNSCSAQPVCCENNSFNGVIAIGCTPVNINL